MRPHIPPSLSADRSVIASVTRWRNLLEEHALCRKRVCWTNKNASAIEKQRRARRWELEALINNLEYSLLRLCAEATQHHELYTRPTVPGDPLAQKSFSQFDLLMREYHRSKRDLHAHEYRNAARRARTRKRHIIIKDIVNLQWRWMSALFKAIHPNATLPPKRHTDPRVLRPKRLRPSPHKLSL